MELKELEKYGVDIKEINMLIKKAKEDTTYLVVTGEFSAGKSCFINCLLNKEDFLPYGNTECTPILLDMYQGEESSLVVHHIDGSVVRLCIQQTILKDMPDMEQMIIRKL